jgi:hypothetical protein
MASVSLKKKKKKKKKKKQKTVHPTIRIESHLSKNTPRK